MIRVVRLDYMRRNEALLLSISNVDCNVRCPGGRLSIGGRKTRSFFFIRADMNNITKAN